MAPEAVNGVGRSGGLGDQQIILHRLLHSQNRGLLSNSQKRALPAPNLLAGASILIQSAKVAV
jgi:hypothetical protein